MNRSTLEQNKDLEYLKEIKNKEIQIILNKGLGITPITKIQQEVVTIFIMSPTLQIEQRDVKFEDLWKFAHSSEGDNVLRIVHPKV